MTNKNKLKEAMLGAPNDKTTVNVKKDDLGDTKVTSNIKKLGNDVSVNVVDEDFEGSLQGAEAVIEPQDQATLKYLSNVKDAKTGEISQPFTIADKRYQMVRAMNPSKEVVMAVFCHDDVNELGENIIHSVEEFETRIAKPMLEKEKTVSAPIEEEPIKQQNNGFNFANDNDSLNLSQTKHYLVNPKTGKFRRFKTVQELASATMNEEEKYMNLREFKKFFENKIFGVQKKNINEIEPTDSGVDVNDLKTDTKKLVGLIQKRFEVPLSKLDKEIEKVQFLSSMAEILGLEISKLPYLIKNLKTIANPTNESISERKIITKADLNKTLLNPKK